MLVVWDEYLVSGSYRLVHMVFSGDMITVRLRNNDHHV